MTTEAQRTEDREPDPTASDPPAIDEDKLLLDRRYDDGIASFRFRADAESMVRLDVFGRGSMVSARAVVEVLEGFLAEVFPKTGRAYLLVDLRGADGGPVRAQFLFGKWVMKHRRKLQRAAVLGAHPLERRITRGITTIGRIKRFRFFDDASEAIDWLKEAREAERKAKLQQR